MSNDYAKKIAAEKALSFIEDKMIVGLGSGSTSSFFIESLIEAKQSITVVSSSKLSEKKAKEGGLKVANINEVSHIDITVDGADEIDPQKRMIKGGGGAHVREKILASFSREMIVIIDESKWVKKLGTKKLPVEVLFFGFFHFEKKLEKLGYQGTWRKQDDQSWFISDNGNLIFDIQFPSPIENPEQMHEKLIQIPGVVDTGFFFSLAGRVITGFKDGSTKVTE